MNERGGGAQGGSPPDRACRDARHRPPPSLASRVEDSRGLWHFMVLLYYLRGEKKIGGHSVVQWEGGCGERVMRVVRPAHAAACSLRVGVTRGCPGKPHTP